DGREIVLERGRQSIETPQPAKVRHLADANEDRVDRHGRTRGVRRRLVGGHRADGQNHQTVPATSRNPGGQRIEIGQFADAPALCRARGEQRQEEPSVLGHQASGPIAAPPWTTGSRRSSAVANTSGSGRRLTTRNASRGKSKKYPGYTSTRA